MIVVNYGSDIFKTTYETLEASDILVYLEQGMEVAVKPNLVVPSPAFNGATTHPQVVEAIICFLKDFGITQIKIIESSWVGDCTKEAYIYCGYEDLSKKHNIPLVDLKEDSHRTLKLSDIKVGICDEALNTDFLINVPVLKAHCQTLMTCCMKNLKGCIPDSEKRRFHTIGLHKPIAVLNFLLKTGYCVVDGICGDLSFEEGGNPVETNRIIAGRNPLTLDSYCAQLIGLKPDEIGYLTYGKDLGLGEYFSQEIELIELNSQSKPAHTALGRERLGGKYSELIDENSACSACYSSIIHALHRTGKFRFNEKIHIGQGFRGKGGKGVGVGTCACGFEIHAPGCPPKAADIVDFFKTI